MELKKSDVAKQIASLIKYTSQYYTKELSAMTRILESENELAKYSSMDFVIALRPILKELSAMDIEPFRDVYMWYLDEAKEMVLSGQDLADILSYFDMKLVRMRR